MKNIKKPFVVTFASLCILSLLASCGKSSSSTNTGTDTSDTGPSSTNTEPTNSDPSSVDPSTDPSTDSSSTEPVDDDPMAQYTRTVYMSGDEFKVLNLADIQLHDGDDQYVTRHVIETLINEQQPDMIVVLGDSINDDTTYDVKESAAQIVSYIDSFNIPWAPIFGNHDFLEYHPEGTKKTGGAEYLAELYKQANNCLYLDGPDDVLGYSNYMINVVKENTNDLVETFVFLDSKTHGLDESSVRFYEDCIRYATKLNNGVVAPSVVFDHIPILEYLEAFNHSLENECHDIVGVPGQEPLSAGTDKMFAKAKELGSTRTFICGHDHEDAYYSVYNGITLAHAMKSSDGDDEGGLSFAHPMGGLVLTIDGNEDKLEYTKVTDMYYTVNSSFPYHPEVLPYWLYSGAKLAFDIKLPTSGTIKFNLQGTNLMRTSIAADLRQGAWNRLTNNITINASTKTVDKGTLIQVSGDEYRYEVDVASLDLNKGSGEVAIGDETVRLVYFHSATNEFPLRNIRFEKEEVTETNQLDLSNATVSSIEDQYWNEAPSKPEPTVELNGVTLQKGTDIIYSYSNNFRIGEATLRIIPSANGEHRFKGEKVVTFNIVGNPDADTLPGHENATTVNSDSSYCSTDRYNDWVIAKDWYNCGKKLHIELKRLSNGLVTSGETVRFSLMGANTNEGIGQVDPSGTWNRLTSYYMFDFSGNKIVCYQSGKPNNVIATGESLGDGWFSLNIDFRSLEMNSSENVHGNDKETMQRVYFDQLKRSFKFDNVSLVD